MVLRAWRQDRIRRRPFPAEWNAILRRTFPRIGRLSAADRTELEGLIHVFLAEKRFEGAAELIVTDEMRLTIAAQACLLLLHRVADPYPGLFSVIVYPHEYLASQRVRDEIGLVRETRQVRLGETGARGAVVVSWDAAERGASDENGGRSVVLHEFAHLLDAEAGGFDGAPRLRHRTMYADWSLILEREFDALRRGGGTDDLLDLDAYAATSPAEFFAVATERFFQAPHALAHRRPALFAALAGFYEQDPRQSMPETPSARGPVLPED